jgi:regulator of protease activity HflC (stomatin/prohibitin superfamily)
MKENPIFKSFILIILLLLLIIFGSFGIGALYAKYNVWRSSLEGEAELKKADWNRQISVREAQAKKDAAIMLAQAEIERAKGVATANKIIGDSLKKNEEYLRYLWIDGVQHTTNQIIYIPTEANLPILEATRIHEKRETNK